MTTCTLPPLLRAATSTFESLALLVADPAVGGEGAGVPLPHVVSVAFTGPARGRLVLRVSDDLRAALAANMLGIDAPALALQADALGELANVVCGNLLPALAGRAAVFRLAAPAPAGPHAFAAGEGERCIGTAALAVEGGRAELALHLADGTAFAERAT